MKKFYSLYFKSQNEETKYEFETNQKNEIFSKKCETTIQEISSFLENISSM